MNPWPTRTSEPTASLSWSKTTDGPWETVWSYDPKIEWKDGDVITRTLLWPEVDKQVRSLPQPLPVVYVRYAFDGIAIDDFPLSLRPV